MASQTLETTDYLGSGGVVDNSTITPWVSPAIAIRYRTGLDNHCCAAGQQSGRPRGR
ncbi:hypothetical protein AB0J82_35085 [Asanoa sp. NPDC049518]|uniref:hypothetical protein n=1 Tax=unclassified Asanoa TaxID=2685164 RepID=UPI00343A87EA